MSKPRVLGLITARGGSKGVPGKNIRNIGGLPLIAWSIMTARKSTLIDTLVVSSDDSAILETAREYDCETPFVRPAELATDEARSVDVVLHAIQTLEKRYDLLVLLQPTSPLRSAEDIDSCINILLETNTSSVVSVCSVDKSPYWMYSMNVNGILRPIMDLEDRPARRQDAQPVYLPNGAVYVVNIEQFERQKSFIDALTRGYIMPSNRSLDVDTEEDLLWLEWLCERHPELIPG